MQAHPLSPLRKRLLQVLGARLVFAVRIARGANSRATTASSGRRCKLEDEEDLV